eukprot:618689-Rhodomonas_salina.2
MVTCKGGSGARRAAAGCGLAWCKRAAVYPVHTNMRTPRSNSSCQSLGFRRMIYIERQLDQMHMEKAEREAGAAKEGLEDGDPGRR